MQSRVIIAVMLAWFVAGCGNNKASGPALFTALQSTTTGLRFTNKLTPTPQFNMFTYMYFYNGAGVGAGDFNNDGWVDVFFAANQGSNKLFLNKGALKFSDVTKEAVVPQDGGWSTGVSVADVNDDGLLDIYVCRVGNFETLRSKNQLLICKGIKNGVPFYKDEAAAYGLDFSGFSTQASFFDYDLDGDLDCFLLNHSVHQNGTFAERSKFVGTYHPLSGDRLFRNDGNRFTDVTVASKIHSSAISYGLGIAASDINLDGYPDLYIGNDFHENDYLYINNKNGTFTDEITSRTMHTSQFSMGVDVADINGDAHPEIISADMLPSDPYILKRSLGEDEFNTFYMKIRYGYHYQYTRNNLQLNRGNGSFSDVGLYAGVAATDWSWSPLWMDFDNDGQKDLFITNGIPKRLNDIDYVNYVSNDEVQAKIQKGGLAAADMALIDKFPQIKLHNRFFLNKGNVQFEDVNAQVANDGESFSNGAACADFDNDGDVDVVVNNIQDEAILYENNTAGKNRSLQLQLRGPKGNRNGVGAMVVVYNKGNVNTYEKFAAKGFLSSSETPLHLGMSTTAPDSVVLVWPGGRYQHLSSIDSGRVTMHYEKAGGSFNYAALAQHKANYKIGFQNIAAQTGIQFLHEENPFVEFDREPLIPFMVSKEGPAAAVGDVNGDGLDDVYLGSAKLGKGVVYVQTASGFKKLPQPALDKDSVYEDVGAAWVDVNKDGAQDLVVASGGNEYFGKDEHLLPRVYLNNGKGLLQRKGDAFTNIFLTASCVAPHDFNGDGAVDLFIGGRAVPWAYGAVPTSYLLQNDGTGKFTDVTLKYSWELSNAGFVKSAQWVDLDKDGDTDLLLALEWDAITVYENIGGKLQPKKLSAQKGWWNFALPFDADGDGDLDVLAGNNGKNSRLQPTVKEPVRMYFADFDGNGQREQVLTYYLNGRELPFANKDEMQKQMPILKKRFLMAEDFAKSDLSGLFPNGKLKDAAVLTADYFDNALFINNGKGGFTVQSLPWQAQLTPYRSAAVMQLNNDGLPDVLLGGNFYENNIQMGRYDADYGTALINKGNGVFEPASLQPLQIKGQVRQLVPLKIKNSTAYLVVRNNDSALVIKQIP